MLLTYFIYHKTKTITLIHEGITPEIAEGLKILRERIKEIPSSKLDETINIASWNIREFGKEQRTDAAIHYIAEILSNFDLIAIVELRENLSDLSRVMKILGPYWKVIFSDIIMDSGGNQERIAYLYDKRAAVFTGLAAESDPIRTKDEKSGEYLPTITWWRSPYMASFAAGRFDFVLLAAHIRWGKDENERIKELQLLADWIDKRSKSKFVEDKDIIVMGDFNIPSLESDLFKAITSRGLEIPESLVGVHGTNLAKDKRYDQILHYRRYTSTSKSTGGVADYYQNDWRALFPQDQYPDMTQEKFTFQMSDHLPLWMQLDLRTEGEELDQIIGAKN